MLSGIVAGLALLATVARAQFLGTFVQPVVNDLPEENAEEGHSLQQKVSLLNLNLDVHQPTAHEPGRDEGLPAHTYDYARVWMVAHGLLTWRFLHSLSFSGIVKALCVTSNVVVQVSPLPQVQRWGKRGDTGGADSAPYVAIAFGGWQWCFYGFFAWITTGRSGFLVLVQSNSLGALLGTFYTWSFCCRCQSEIARLTLRKYLCFVVALAFFQGCAVGLLPAQRALFLVGLVSAFCGFMSALSVLVTVPKVLSQKDSRSIPGAVVSAGALSALCWLVCGSLLEDMLIAVPSIVSLTANLACVYLKLLYPSSEDGDMGTKEASCSNDLPLAPLHNSRDAPSRPARDMRARLCERMEQRWRSALMLKSLRNTPKAKETTPLLLGKESEWQQSLEAQAPRESTGGTG